MITYLFHVFIQLAMPEWFPRPPIALYAHLVSVRNIRSILSNRTHSVKFVVLQNLIIQSLNLRYN